MEHLQSDPKQTNADIAEQSSDTEGVLFTQCETAACGNNVRSP